MLSVIVAIIGFITLFVSGQRHNMEGFGIGALLIMLAILMNINWSAA